MEANVHRLLAIIIVLSLGLSASAESLSGVNLQVTDNHAMGLTVKFDLSNTSTNVNDAGFTPLDMTFSDNEEEFPVFTRLISVPMGYKPVIKILERKSTHLLPQQVSFDYNPTPITTQQIAGMTLDPPEAVVCGKVDIWRGRTIAPLVIYPVQRVTENNAVIENEVLEFEVVFEPDPLASNFTPFNDIPGNELGRMIDNIILNHESDDCVEVQQAHRGRMLMLIQDYPREGDDTEYLRRAIPWIDSLATWKRHMGYSVEIVEVDFRNVSPQEIKEDIIRPRYEDQENPLTYLLLIGGKLPEEQVFFPTYNPIGGEEGDHHYSYFSENPYLSDIAVGRMEVTSFQQLKNSIKRIFNYQMEPFVEADDNDDDGGEWFERALFTAENIVAPGGQFVPSMIHLGRWMVDKLERYGYEKVDTLWAEDEDSNINDEVREIIVNGVGIAISRGWLSACYDVDDIREPIIPDNGRKTPFVIAVTCLSFETQEGFFQSADNRGEGGPIATIAMKGLSHTTPNNSLLGGSLRGMVHFDLNQVGLIQMFGKYQMWSDQRYQLGVLALDNVAVFRLMGDPTTEIITRNPIPLEAEYPEQISIGATGFSVQVSSQGESVPDAWVSIHQEDGIHLVCQPCEDGWARFTFAPGELSEGALGVTITRYNALPVIDTIELISDGDRVDLTNIQFENEDGMFSNGETIPTTLTFENSGDNDLENLMVNLSADDDHITFSAVQLELGDISAGEDAEVSFDVEIDWSSQAGRGVRIQAIVTSGDASWENAFSFESSGHALVLLGSADPDNAFRSDNEADFSPRLRNTGDRPTPAMIGILTSLSPYVTIIDDEVTYDAISEGGGIEAPSETFTVEAGELSINGSVASFMLSLSASNEDIEFSDHIYFQEVIGEADVTDPYGPDDYGYIMFDSGDTDWAKAPAYDWIEINPNKNEGAIEGTLLEFGDIAVDYDSTIAVELPFAFQYYGEEFDTIAVNSNAWLAFGADKTQYLDFRNQQIPGVQGPDAMVAIFWQDLVNYLDNDLSGVYYHYDEQAGIFIIEWSDMRIYQDFGESVEVQIILYDPTVYTTSSGDGEIKLQYKSATRADGDHTDNQFSTVGIKNLDGTDGLEYVYWDQYPAANNPLENEMAILITTDRLSAIGGIEGSITLEEDHDAPIEGAIVRALRSGFEAVTDVDGNFAFESILSGRERISVSKEGFNTLILAVDVAENEISQVTGRMTHPQIAVPDDPIVKGLHTGNNGITFDFSFENQGNGPLTYDFSNRYLDGSATEYSQTWNADLSELVDNDNYLVGCQFVGDRIYVTSRVGNGDQDEMIYVYVREENGIPTLVNSFLQPSRSEGGFRDLAFDGEYLYGGEIRLLDGDLEDNQDSLFIVKFDQEGNFIDEIFLDVEIDWSEGNEGHPIPFDAPYALAYSPRDSTLITTNGQNDIFVYNMAGELVNQVSLYFPGETISVEGLAWNDSDEDDMPLYIIDRASENGGIRLSKASLETGESMIIGELDGFVRDRPTGLTIGYDWDNSVISMATIAGGSGNRYSDSLRVYELGPDSHYLRINPKHGIVAAGQTAIITMEMRSTGLDEGEYSHGIAITHDGNGDEVFIVSTLVVNDTLRAIGNGSIVPKEFSLEQAYPNPFNNTTRINFALTVGAHTELIIYDISGRKVAELVNEKLEAGRYTALFRPDIQASGIYIYRLQSGGSSAVKRMVYLK